MFDQLKKAAMILLRKLRGGDNQNNPGEVFSNWGYVKLAASCMDNRKFTACPADYANRPHSEQEELKNKAINKKLTDFKDDEDDIAEEELIVSEELKKMIEELRTEDDPLDKDILLLPRL